MPMFLDEELEQIHLDNQDIKIRAKSLMRACLNRLPNPKDVEVEVYLNALKSVDYSWQLFCKRHLMYKADWFRDFVLRCDTSGQVKGWLGW